MRLPALKITLITISLVLFFSFKISASRAQTAVDIQQKIEETKRARDALLEEQKQLQAQLDQIGEQGKSLQTTVKSLDATRAKLANDLKITNNKIATANLTVASLEGNITQTQTEISDHRKAISNSLQMLNNYDGRNVLVNLLAEQFKVAWADTVDLTNLEDSLHKEISQLTDAEQRLRLAKNSKETEKKNLVSLSSQLTGQKQAADETRTAQVALLIATKNKETEYQKLLDQNKQREAEFEKMLFQFESQLKASNIADRPVPAKGTINWPLAKPFITQNFGVTSSSGRLYASGSHNGVDLRASVGTPIFSVRQGTVEAEGNTDEERGCYSYGRWVLIKHDDGLSSLYAHLSSSIVTVGETVATGDTIGYSGGQPGQYGSGYSIGPHLHFGLFVSAGVQVLPYTTSINCKGVSIPLANPSDYLDPVAYLPSL